MTHWQAGNVGFAGCVVQARKDKAGHLPPVHTYMHISNNAKIVIMPENPAST